MLKWWEIKTQMKSFASPFKTIRKTLLQFTLVMGLMALVLHLPALAANLPITKDVYEASNIPRPPDKEGKEIVKDLVLGGLRYVKVIAAVMGILMITVMGFKLVINNGNEEDVTTSKRGLIFAVVAFVIISMSQDIAKIFDMEKRSLLDSPQEILSRVHLFDKQVEIFMTFTKYVIGAYATLMVIRSAISLITGGGNEDETTKHKKGIMFSAAGLLLIYVGEIFVNKVFYKVDKNIYSGINGNHPGVDAKEGVEQISGIINLIISFIAPIAVLMLIAAAIMYVTARGEDDQMQKAKRLLTAIVIGIIIIYGAFAFVNTIILSRLSEIGVIAE